jgi:undecaprenyl diphosphate synthase
MENLQKLPEHVAVIMDGNGRWAEKRGLPRLLGHRAGIAALERALRAAGEMGIHYFSVYAFSTENWNRPADEVSGLMELLQYYARRKVPELVESGVKVRFCGSRENVPQSVLRIMDWSENETASCSRINFIVCFNYGGRQEIIDAIKHARKAGVEIENDEDLRKFLYLPDVPDPDLIIRTSGELRLSNFWLWESSYSEYYFTDVLWPDFTENDLKSAIKSYAGRKRRYGRI